MSRQTSPKPEKPPKTPRRTLITPEGVDLGVDLASAGSRAAAFILDLVILVATVLLLGILLLIVAWGSKREELRGLSVLGLLSLFLLRNAWFIGWELRPGAATPGKRVMKIRVASRSGGRLTADAVFARNLMRELELFMPLTFLGGTIGALAGLQGAAGVAATVAGLVWSLIFLLFPLFNRDRLRAGDLIAGTWVVEAPRPKLLPDLSGGVGDVLPRYPFTPEQVDAYGVMELQVLEDVIRRNDRKVSAEVARRIRDKIGWQVVAQETDAEFLSAYYAALRRRLEQQLLFGKRRKDKHDKV